jgi:hypothetical protein
MDVLTWTTIMALYKLVASVALSENISVCVMCSDTHNFFVVYWILAYV